MAEHTRRCGATVRKLYGLVSDRCWRPTGACDHGRVTDRIKRVKACVNGGRGRDQHPGVPVTPAELAAEAASAAASGAEAVHLHARGSHGRESVRADDVGAAVAAVRGACPGTPIGVSTGLWITGGDVAARRAAVTAWQGLLGAARPDFASVNVSEPGVGDMIELLDAAGIAVEAGVWSVADARVAAEIRPKTGWLRILVEIMATDPGQSPETAADQVLLELDKSGVTEPRLLHGEQETCWPLVSHAGRLGLPTRIGLEDTVTGPDGQPVSGNGELVRLALRTFRAH